MLEVVLCVGFNLVLKEHIVPMNPSSQPPALVWEGWTVHSRWCYYRLSLVSFKSTFRFQAPPVTLRHSPMYRGRAKTSRSGVKGNNCWVIYLKLKRRAAWWVGKFVTTQKITMQRNNVFLKEMICFSIRLIWNVTILHLHLRRFNQQILR